MDKKPISDKPLQTPAVEINRSEGFVDTDQFLNELKCKVGPENIGAARKHLGPSLYPDPTSLPAQRCALGLSRDDVAQYLSCTVAHVSAFESGEETLNSSEMVALAALGFALKQSRHLNVILRALVRIGIIRVRNNGTIHWPIKLDPLEHWKMYFRVAPWNKNFPWFAIFRNRPGVVKWQKGRLLPRRWGFRILGIEIGDRG